MAAAGVGSARVRQFRGSLAFRRRSPQRVLRQKEWTLLLRDPWSALGRVDHAGGVFIGEDSMEALGDYLAGPSHVMPTMGTARFSSPVNVRDFQKIISVVGLNRATLERIAPDAARLARAEGLEAHARAIEARLEDNAP